MKELTTCLESENGSIKHSFFYDQSDNIEHAHNDCKVVIENAGKSKNAKGWNNYPVYISKNNRDWEKTEEYNYDKGAYSFVLPLEYFYASWFPTYSYDKLQYFIKSMGLTCNLLRNETPYLMFGSFTKPTIVITARQHPGESMASFTAEGIISEIIEHNKELLQFFSFIIFPMLNVDGVKNLNHRYNSEGVDLNRDWKDSKSNAVKNVKAFLKHANIIPFAFFDIHGDEVSKLNYVIPKRAKKGRSNIENSFFKDDFIVISSRPSLRKLIKRMVKRNKYSSNQNSARHYFASVGFDSFTLELSAHACTPEKCKEIGSNLIRSLLAKVRQ